MEKSDLTDIADVTAINNKNNKKTRGKKRKRKDSDTSLETEDALPENALEVENNVIASAAKNNLDDLSVKKILKKVVTNDHVLALVKLREEEEISRTDPSGVEPKLTRAKVKELKKVSPSTAPWNLENLELTPIKHIPVKTRPEVKALIAQELPEDEDDEEYEPTHEDVLSDDDQGTESCSDIDSQPRTPATPRSFSTTSPKVVRDGPFKVPQEISTPSRRKLILDEEEATIALRTRSKLCLSETPIEYIESSFVPPDELPVPPVDDHLWNEFLNECLNPASVSRNEDDDDADPEYNVAADPDAHDEDEALENTIIKISKKELNDLVTELFNIIPEATVDDELSNIGNGILPDHSKNVMNNGWDGKQEPLSDEERPLRICEKLSVERSNSFNRISIGKSEPMDEDPLVENEKVQRDNNMQEVNGNEALKQCQQVIIRPQNNVVRIAVEEQVMCVQPPPAAEQTPPPILLQIQSAPNPVTVTLQNEKVMLPEQVLILQQHLRQHIQIATSNFLQLFVNPLHWAKAPAYKEYLETFSKMADENPSSVVNVCNLRPAVELVHKWEESVSKDTPENTAMVEFIQKEAERWRRNTAHNKLYVGEFHETFNKVVANSPVFLYPYLLPPMPFAADAKRRFSYLRSEDELIAMGLDQFWKYVDSNPDIFTRPPRSHPRHRWGLVATAELVARFMFPWLSPRTLVQHVMTARRQGDKDNPIYKFFSTNEITPVKHKLIPYNPKLTLYEQPEHEMPRCWLRYLSKTSKRFKVFLRRRQNVLGQTPKGVEINVASPANPPPKEPLPIDFTKEIKISQTNKKTTEKPVLADKFDLNIQNKDSQPPLNFFQLVQTSNGSVLVPLVIQSNPNTSNVTLVTKPNTIVDNLSEPKTVESTNTVNCNIAPITSAVEMKINKNTNNINEANKQYHCSCCNILRRITKIKQTVITDFFRNKNNVSVSNKKCQCNESRYPTVTKKLKLLVERYKSKYKRTYEEIHRRLGIKKTRNEDKVEGTTDLYSREDLDYVSAFQQRLTIRGQLAKNTHIKGRVNTLFSRFDVDADDPIKLALELDQTFNIEMVDVFKEFVGFLNPEQADKINRFRDYFIHNCVEGLMEEIEEHVKDKQTKDSLLWQISGFFTANQWTPCSMCSALLVLQRAHPELARYTFALFPHSTRSRTCKVEPKKTDPTPPAPIQVEPVDKDRSDDDTNDNRTLVENEANNHLSDQEDNVDDGSTVDTDRNIDCASTIVKTEVAMSAEVDTPEITISKTEIQYSNSDTSMTIVTEDELVKSEPSEWKREEDKLILEMLKQHLTPEERKEKTILEIIEEKEIVEILNQSLLDKTYDDIKERMLNILKMLVLQS